MGVMKLVCTGKNHGQFRGKIVYFSQYFEKMFFFWSKWVMVLLTVCTPKGFSHLIFYLFNRENVKKIDFAGEIITLYVGHKQNIFMFYVTQKCVFYAFFKVCMISLQQLFCL